MTRDYTAIPIYMHSSSDGSKEQSDSMDYSHPIGKQRPYRILVPIHRGLISDRRIIDIERLLRTANALAVDHDGSILLLGMVDSFDSTVVPEFNSTEAGEDERNVDQNEEFEEVRRQMGKLLELAAEVGSKDRIRGVIGGGEQFSDIVLGAIDHFGCESVLLLQDEYADQQALLSQSIIDTVVADAACDIFVENIGEIDGESAIYLPSAESPFVERIETGQIESILLAAGSGPHTALAAEAARALARASGASIEIVHLVPPDPDGRQLASGREILDFASFVVQNEQSTTTAIIEASNPAAEIIERSESYDVVVLGAPQEHSLLHQLVFTSVPKEIMQQTETTVLMAKDRNDHSKSVYYRWKQVTERVIDNNPR